MSEIDLDEGHISALHYARFAEAVEEAGVESALDLPPEIIQVLQEQNRRDWVTFVAKRDGKTIPKWDIPSTDNVETDVVDAETEEEETDDELAD